jgi:predicted deacetylase
VAALCVSIHDVAPRTLRACEAIADAIERIAPRVPLTLLVVPQYHGDTALPESFVQWISHRIERGDELALHGFTHLDSGGRSTSTVGRVTRSIYTAGEGEFSALSREDASELIARGRVWFGERGWKAQGFVAPAWLVSPGTWDALRDFDFMYTTTLSRFHALERGVALRAPSVVYSTRSAWRRNASRIWNTALARASARMPLVRFGFHPADADHREVMSHALRLLDTLAERRVAVTKSAFARTVR